MATEEYETCIHEAGHVVNALCVAQRSGILDSIAYVHCFKKPIKRMDGYTLRTRSGETGFYMSFLDDILPSENIGILLAGIAASEALVCPGGGYDGGGADIERVYAIARKHKVAIGADYIWETVRRLTSWIKTPRIEQTVRLVAYALSVFGRLTGEEIQGLAMGENVWHVKMEDP